MDQIDILACLHCVRHWSWIKCAVLKS